MCELALHTMCAASHAKEVCGGQSAVAAQKKAAVELQRHSTAHAPSPKCTHPPNRYLQQAGYNAQGRAAGSGHRLWRGGHQLARLAGDHPGAHAAAPLRAHRQVPVWCLGVPPLRQALDVALSAVGGEGGGRPGSSQSHSRAPRCTVTTWPLCWQARIAPPPPACQISWVPPLPSVSAPAHPRLPSASAPPTGSMQVPASSAPPMMARSSTVPRGGGGTDYLYQDPPESGRSAGV